MRALPHTVQVALSIRTPRLILVTPAYQETWDLCFTAVLLTLHELEALNQAKGAITPSQGPVNYGHLRSEIELETATINSPRNVSDLIQHLAVVASF